MCGKYGGLLATLVYIILDIFVFQTTAILVTNFVIPSLGKSRSMLNMNIVFPILCRLWKSTARGTRPAHQPAGLSAPASMYISRKIAETYPLVFESCMMLAYNTPWCYPMHDDTKTRVKGTDPVDEESHTHKMPTHHHEDLRRHEP